MKDHSRYIIVIDTDQFAGNFVRELCGWTTGQYGYGGDHIGSFESMMYAREEDDTTLMLFSNMEHTPDDKGNLYPCRIWESPNGQMNSVALFFESRPTEQQIAIIKRRCGTFNNRSKKIFDTDVENFVGFRLVEAKIVYITENI